MKKIYLEIECVDNLRVKGYILDISKSGIGFAALKSIKKGTNIIIKTKNKLFPALKAEVVRSSKLTKNIYSYKIGARFINLTNKQSKYLAKFIEKIEKQIIYLLRAK